MKNSAVLLVASTSFAFSHGSIDYKRYLEKRNFNLGQEDSPQELIVSFNSISNKGNFDPVKVITEILDRAKVSSIAASVDIRNHIPGTALYTVGFSGAKSVNELSNLASTLQGSEDIRFVEANQRVSLSNVIEAHKSVLEVPVDEDTTYNLELIHTGKAWEVERGSSEILVSVIDTGVDWRHEDIKDSLSLNKGESGIDENGQPKSSNGIDDDKNGYIDDLLGWDFHNNDNDPMDDNGHGTHCAGVIGASHNEKGVDGINQSISMLPLKFLDERGGGDLDNAVAAIYYSISRGAAISSNSWGGGDFSVATFEALQLARKKGILFVFAAGNNRRNNDKIEAYPSNYEIDNIIAVAASDHSDQLADFSNYGKKFVDLTAPGVDIWSSVLDQGYAAYSGTSMAAPHVSGVAALLMSHYPEWNYRKVRYRIENSIDRLPQLIDLVASSGRLNAGNALEEDEVAPGKVQGFSQEELTLTSATLHWAQAGDDANEGAASHYIARLFDSPISNLSQWENGDLLPEGAIEISDWSEKLKPVLARVLGLPVNSEKYLHVRAMDNVGNLGPLSEAYPIVLPKGQVYKTVDLFQDLGEWDLEGDWVVQGDLLGEAVLSDAPTGQYRSAMNVSAVLAKFPYQRESVLAFEAKYSFEANYDYGFVEVSIEGKEWEPILVVTDKIQGWQRFYLELPKSESHPSSSSEVQVRFRTVSDHSIEQEGWRIKNISFYGRF